MTLGRTLLAALPMYDSPELEAANDTLWSAIAVRLRSFGVAAPSGLVRGRPLEALWRDPDLLLGQACGYPLVTGLAGSVRLVATPSYRAAGCEGPFHRSALVVRADSMFETLVQLRGARCAVNDWASNTGMNLLRATIAPLAGGARFFSQVTPTGSHVASARAVAKGDLDLAALDCVSLAHLRRHQPELTRQIRIIGWTRRSPGLPLVTSRRTDDDTCAALRRALEEVCHDAACAAARDTLLIDGFHQLPLSEYETVLHMQDAAASQDYPQIA
jgi:ABC-type phosphate/phosphonate transport system substrate-binding protein